jgi:hypothetical protein
MIGAGGLVVSIIAFAVGAILDWAVTVQNQHGVNVNKVGVILMTREGAGQLWTTGRGTLFVGSIRPTNRDRSRGIIDREADEWY